MKPRGFFGIGIEHTKTEHNVGTLWRTAYIFGASFMFTIGRRYHKQSSDTVRAPRHVPLWHFQTIDELLAHSPHNAPLVGVELDPHAKRIENYVHPHSAIYLLGAEDNGLSKHALQRCHHLVQLPGEHSLNVAVAGSIVLFDRLMKTPTP